MSYYLLFRLMVLVLSNSEEATGLSRSIQSNLCAPSPTGNGGLSYLSPKTIPRSIGRDTSPILSLARPSERDKFPLMLYRDLSGLSPQNIASNHFSLYCGC
jgi:hypothetical protein